MARFKVDVYTERNKTVSRLGRRTISAHIRGWDFGINVECNRTEEGNLYTVYTTGGSNRSDNQNKIFEYLENE